MVAKKFHIGILNLTIKILSGFAPLVFSQAAHANGILCFMETSQGQFIDLSFLCGRKTQPVIRPNNYDPAFAKDLTEAISGYPAEKEILSKISPKKFADEARNICEKLRDGTFTEYRNQAISALPDRETAPDQFRAISFSSKSSENSDRAISNISFNLSKELGTKYFCQEFND
jgi:hypothetical protein